MSTTLSQRIPTALMHQKADQSIRSVIKRSVQSMSSFASDTAGDVAILFGLMAFVMFGLIGAAVDMGRWLSARDQTQAALDSAVIAVGRAMQTQPNVDQQALGKLYYDQAVKTRLTVVAGENVKFEKVTTAGEQSVIGTTNARIATPFMGLLGVKHLYLVKQGSTPASGQNSEDAGSEVSKATLSIGDVNLEIAMMLDTSGSMGETTSSGNAKYIDMRDAASDLVNILVWADQGTFTSRVAIVPFSGDVRVPSSILTAVTNPLSVANFNLGTVHQPLVYNKTPCVAERMGSNKHTDAAPGIGDYIPYEYTSAGKCAQSQSSDELMALSNNKGNLLAKIAGLEPRGSTAGHIGTAWSYYLLSPKWATYLPSNSQPASYSDTKTKKIAILMTDGEYNSTHDNNGVPTTAQGAGGSANGNSSSGQSIAICNQMRQSGIDVYTVGFNMSSASSTAVNTLKNCASDRSKYYDAENGEQLKQAFRDIALKLSELRLTK